MSLPHEGGPDGTTNRALSTINGQAGSGDDRTMIWLLIKHPTLAAAVRLALQSQLSAEGAAAGPAAFGDAVVTTTMETSPLACQALTECGTRVVVLTPLATSLERQKYAQAGAAKYLEMSGNVSALLEALCTTDQREGLADPA